MRYKVGSSSYLDTLNDLGTLTSYNLAFQDAEHHSNLTYISRHRDVDSELQNVRFSPGLVFIDCVVLLTAPYKMGLRLTLGWEKILLGEGRSP